MKKQEKAEKVAKREKGRKMGAVQKQVFLTGGTVGSKSLIRL